MEIKNCRVCESTNFDDVLDLGNQPWGNDFRATPGDAEKYPLIGVFCNDCSTFQIKHNVSKEVMYEDHTYLSGANASMSSHFQSVSDKACKNLSNDQNFVVDIGSNDGTLLRTYKDKGLKVLGVEPCENIALKAIDSGIPTVIDFFNNDVANSIITEHGKANIISAANVFYHVEELHDIVKGIKNLLSDNGTFIVQGTYLPNLINNNEFDIIYHEHLLYYRIENLNFLLNKFGLEVFDVDFADVHGGSFIAYVSHSSSKEISSTVKDAVSKERSGKFHEKDTYISFAKRVESLKSSIHDMLEDLVLKGNTVYAYGAPVKGTVMMNYCGIDSSLTPLAVEINKEKIGKYIPGVDVKVVDELSVEEPDYYFLLSWNFLDVFMKSKEFKSGKRKFIVPVPEPRIVCKKE
jgi:SAM-dependent methyltransferase|tara:strand:+ start:91 stop:1308 length:1218 start_codon:yes stop_codon:yes gene_type:complete